MRFAGLECHSLTLHTVSQTIGTDDSRGFAEDRECHRDALSQRFRARNNVRWNEFMWKSCSRYRSELFDGLNFSLLASRSNEPTRNIYRIQCFRWNIISSYLPRTNRIATTFILFQSRRVATEIPRQLSKRNDFRVPRNRRKIEEDAVHAIKTKTLRDNRSPCVPRMTVRIWLQPEYQATVFAGVRRDKFSISGIRGTSLASLSP